MGLFSGSTTTKSNETFDSGPSSFQRPYLDDTFGQAKSNYQSQAGTPYYQGQTYAGMSDEAKATLDKLRGYAGTTGLGDASTLSSMGNTLAGYAGSAGSLADQYAAMAGQDPTKANLAAAAQYANDPYLDGQIDAASRDVTRNLSESILPSIDRAASATGNINSSRAGVASGIAQRGAADRIGDIASTMRSAAYDRGLSLAQSDRAAQLAALGGASDRYSGLAGQGANALGQGATAAYNAFGQLNNSYATQQQDQQGQLDADFAKWQGQDTRASDLLSRYNDIVGSNQWGQSGTSSSNSKTKSSASILSQLMGAASVAASAYTGMPGKAK